MHTLKAAIEKKKASTGEGSTTSASKWKSQKDLILNQTDRVVSSQPRKRKAEEELKELAGFIGSQKKFREFKKLKEEVLAADSAKLAAILRDSDEIEVKKSDCEVQSALRSFGYPAVYFAEDMNQRWNRFCIVENTKDNPSECDSLLKEYFEKHFIAVSGTPPEFEVDPNLKISDIKAPQLSEADCTLLLQSDHLILAEGLSPSQKVLYFINGLLFRWIDKLQNKSEDEKQSVLGNLAFSIYSQTKTDLKPLIRKLRDESLLPDVLSKLVAMVDLCSSRNYVAAHDKYIELAIGNAAWPMGVTMVGIHERVGRSKIFSSEIAHILNEETTRKYIQMWKRLISICQIFYPHVDPSQMVQIASTSVPML